MKRCMALSLAGVLIFALSATVYAQAPKLEFKVSGFIDTQTFWSLNVPVYNFFAGLFKVTNPTFAFYPAPSPVTGLPTAGYNKQ